jgi:hypothetical protein
LCTAPSSGLLARSGDPQRFGRMFDLSASFAAPGTLWLLLGWAVPHAFSFAAFWRRGGGRERTTPQQEMARPYGRVLVMHLTVILGGAALVLARAPGIALAGLAALKTAADLAARFRAHRAPEAAT